MAEPDPERAHGDRHGHDQGRDFTADPAERVADRDELLRALAELTPHQRAVLVLRHYEGYDDAAIAAVLGCGDGTVRTHATRGAQRLRELLEKTRQPEEPR